MTMVLVRNGELLVDRRLTRTVPISAHQGEEGDAATVRFHRDDSCKINIVEKKIGDIEKRFYVVTTGNVSASNRFIRLMKILDNKALQAVYRHLGHTVDKNAEVLVYDVAETTLVVWDLSKARPIPRPIPWNTSPDRPFVFASGGPVTALLNGLSNKSLNNATMFVFAARYAQGVSQSFDRIDLKTGEIQYRQTQQIEEAIAELKEKLVAPAEKPHYAEFALTQVIGDNIHLGS